MNIGNRKIGPGHAPYVIAEIGVNHDGQVERALQLTDAAADAGADAVKLQYFETDLLMSKAAKLAAYQQAAGETDPIVMLRRLELSIEDMAKVVERAHERRIHVIVTVFSTELVDTAETLGWDAYKTASPDIIHKPLLERLMQTGKPMIVSTGASTLDEVLRAVDWLETVCERLALLQCVSSYPAPDPALGGISALRMATSIPIGYSDHTPSIETGRDAVRAGAVLLERHITYNRNAAGPDHGASLEPDEFREYIDLAQRSAEESIDTHTPSKTVLGCERDVRLISRQSVVATRDLTPGDILGADDLTCKRPGIGIEPSRMHDLIGTTVSRDVEADTPLTDDAISVVGSAR